MRTFAQKPKATQQATSAKFMRPGRAHLGRSPEVNSMPHLQRTIGNQAVQRLLEANSEDVKHDSSSTEIARFGHDFSRIPMHSPTAVPPIIHEVLASPGQPLDATTRAFMEPRFGHDFGRVRVHVGTRAAESAHAVNALAYTVGQHVVFGGRQPSPGTSVGRQLMAHELAHVVQQSRSGPVPALDPSAPHEREADAAALSVAMGQPSVQVVTHTGVGLARNVVDKPWGGLSRLTEIVNAAVDLILGGLPPRPIQTLGDIRRSLTDLARLGVREAQLFLNDLDRLVMQGELMGLAKAQAQLEDLTRVARQFADQATGTSRSLSSTRWDLGFIVRSGGPNAERAGQLLEEIEELRTRINDLERARQAGRRLATPVEQLIRAEPPAHLIRPEVPPPTERASAVTPAARTAAGTIEKPAPLGPPAITATGEVTVPQRGSVTPSGGGPTRAVTTTSGLIGEAGPTTPGTSAGAKAESTVATVAATEVTASTRLSRLKSGLAKLGSVGLHVLLPGPLDALALMAQFAGSYAAAHEAIRSRNVRDGFAIGLSSFLLERKSKAEQEHFDRDRVEDMEVTTQVVGAVGLAEKSHNAGLDAGFSYGKRLSHDAESLLREIGFAALKAQGKMLYPEQRGFTDYDVFSLAQALRPTVDQIFKAMRLEAEKKLEAERKQTFRELGPHRGMKF